MSDHEIGNNVESHQQEASFEDLVDSGNPATLQQTIAYYEERYGLLFESYMDTSFREAANNPSLQDSQYFHACLKEIGIRSGQTPSIGRQERYAELMLNEDLKRVRARIDYLEAYVHANGRLNRFQDTYQSNIAELDRLKDKAVGLENTVIVIKSAKHLRRSN